MKYKNQILATMQHPDYVPLRLSELREAMELAPSQEKTLRRDVEEMLAKGYLARIKKNRYIIPQDANLVTGEILFRQSGQALLIKDPHLSQDGRETVQIASEDTWVALHKDRVLVRYSEGPRRQRRFNRNKKDRSKEEAPWGRVIRILERHRTEITGTLQKSHHFYYVVPDDPRIIQDIYVPDPGKADISPEPQTGDKVLVQLHEWKQRHINPEGTILKVLGKSNEPGAELSALLHKFDLREEFPAAVQKQVEALPDSVDQGSLRGRLDLRQKRVFTIDPDDSKDFDDALSYEPLADGKIRVGIHIADVSAYVRPGTALDKDARRRGNSTYLVGKVVPMLPFALSNGLCSLVEGQDRLTKSVFVTFDQKGQAIDHQFHQSVIRSHKRLTYKQALAFLREDDPRAAIKVPLPGAHQTGATGRPLSDLSPKELSALQKDIRGLWNIGSRLRRQRMKNGSLDLDMAEVNIFVDESGWADRIEQEFSDESHQLVEEFMLLANETVGREFRRAQIPTIFRVHPEPVEEKLVELRDYLAVQGIKVGDLTKRPEVTKALRLIREHANSYTLRIAFLRSLQQARYRAHPEGHYGLNLKNYLHFTSPIRRYADLIVHRCFENFLAKTTGNQPGQKVARPPRLPSQGDLESAAEHISRMEQNSTEAEREHVKIKLLEFFERETTKKKKTEFNAIITDLRNHGMFIELTVSQAFGLVHVSTMQDDLYHLDGNGTSLVGRRRKRKFQIGDEISVVTERVDRFKRQIDFRLADQVASSKRSRRSRGRKK
ncbi:MAG: RNB domain-containing ribonuclease [Opitutales bacterium]|nr:RNB domain-containing ribonuclease [Opitutales bacterium]MCH8540969.1 RNB domain-containing ribonuclease [Opitutales bacterium]